MDKPQIVICLGSSCFSRGNEKNVQIVENYLKQCNLMDEVDLELSGALCQGRCAEGPIVAINGEIFAAVDPGVMLELLKKYLPRKSAGNPGV